MATCSKAGLPISCLLFNARSVVDKIDYLACRLGDHFASIVLVTETWLSECIPNSFLSFGGTYQIFRKDRIATVGGGVMALVEKNLTVCPVVLPDIYSSLELLCLDVIVSHLNLRVIVG